ncbi:zinc finger protein 654-like isoform X2 [Takifugu flavidus]|nr:zinc finger protein 654-like isoform X2 [Takifugu flavidus]
MCKTFLKHQLHNGDMYYIWDLVFIWSRLHLRAHPSRQGFLAECLDLASSATNVRAIFPFIKLVTTELGGEGVHVCLELCTRALQLCDMQADVVTPSLVCKTIAFLLPHDLEICRACALLVFCQERSLEAYRTVCLLYMLPDQEPHPNNSPVRTNVRFHILQMLKERLCFDPEFWNLLTLRAHCMELMSDKVLKAAVLSEMEEEEENKCSKELLLNNCLYDCTKALDSCQTIEAVEKQERPIKQRNNAAVENRVDASSDAPLKRRKWRRRLRRRRQSKSDDEGDLCKDPEFRYNLKSPGSKLTGYSLRHNHTCTDNSASLKLPLNRKREYLSRCVKSQILKRKGRKKRWLQGLPRLELIPTVPEKKIRGRGRKRLWRSLQKLELCYPDNEIFSTEFSLEKITDTDGHLMDMPVLKNELQQQGEAFNHQLQQEDNPEKDSGFEENNDMDFGCSILPQSRETSQTQLNSRENPPNGPQATPAVEADASFDSESFDMSSFPVEQVHSYCIRLNRPDGEDAQPPEFSASEELNDDTEPEAQTTEETEMSDTEGMSTQTWRDKALRTQKYAHVRHHCKSCHKDYKGLNVMRHALSHLRGGKIRCILCGKRLHQFSSAKKHILEHIDQMDKDKPSDKETASVDTKATNGKSDKGANPNQPRDENETPVSNQKTNQITKSKKKVPTLKRENRIIRNLRTLIKKTSVLHSKGKNPNANTFKQADFQDDQVVIKDGMVIIKDPHLQETDGKETPDGEAADGADSIYHLCPSESCDKVFLKINSTLTKHAIKYHISEEKVLEKTFMWCKHKCILCSRNIQFLEHYKDHMKLHYAPLQHFCYHLECNMRFLTQQELKDHVSSHQPFRPQCRFTDCETLFPNLQCLHDHEWRHYVPAPQREELQVRQKVQSAEAPWKQRVKVEEIWLQNKKEQRDPSCDQAALQQARAVEGKNRPTLDNHSAKTEVSDGGKAAVNGCEDRVANPESTVAFSSSQAGDGAGAGAGDGAGESSSKSRRNKPPLVVDPLNVRVVEDMSTLSEGIQKSLGEPHITEHKSFHPKDPSYATFVKAPFVRPPPSTYLDESVLSMRKRRTTEEPPPRINMYWSYKRKETLEAKDEQKKSEAREQKMRTRCNKCLSSFSSVEELQKHQALNTCSALFGFDSDDES